MKIKLIRITRSNYVLHKHIIEKITKKMDKNCVSLLEENSNDVSLRNTHVINT